MKRSRRAAAAALVLALCLLIPALVTAARRAIDVGALDAPDPDMNFRRIMLADNKNEGCAVADVNNDGRPDVIAGPTWFEAPDWTRHPLREVTAAGDFMHNSGDHAYDVDGDGWVDVISGSWFSPAIHWFRNPGKAGLAEEKLWEAHLIGPDHAQTEAMMLHDLNGDGLPELIIDSWMPMKDLVAYSLSREGGKAVWTRHVIGDKGSGHGIAIGDISGDGRDDIAVWHGWYEAPAGDPFAAPWKKHTSPDWKMHEASTPGLIHDVDGDGMNDYMFGHGHGYGVFWMQQTRGENGERGWIKHTVDETFSQSHTLTLADLDGDGTAEVVTGKRVRGHAGEDPGGWEPTCLFRYKWDGAKRKFDRHTIAFRDGVSTGMQINTVDLDGDGDLDIAVAGKSGTWILENQLK